MFRLGVLPVNCDLPVLGVLPVPSFLGVLHSQTFFGVLGVLTVSACSECFGLS